MAMALSIPAQPLWLCPLIKRWRLEATFDPRNELFFSSFSLFLDCWRPSYLCSSFEI
jgi:hypothetical protein